MAFDKDQHLLTLIFRAGVTTAPQGTPSCRDGLLQMTAMNLLRYSSDPG